jgi:hypothetical protein
MRAEAIQRAATFSAARIVPEYEAFYQQVLSQ